MRLLRTIALVSLAGALAGCGGSSTKSDTSSSGGASAKVLVGAGSTFVFPLVSQWTADYSKRTGVTVTYGPIGSGGGIGAISSSSVDFGASDAPLTKDQLGACEGCVQIPWALGGTSVAYRVANAPTHLKLTGPVIADIFLGKVTSWSDPAIAKLNPGASLPSTKITTVYRSDASGTTFNFTDYLSRVSPAFKAKVGSSTQVSFPTGIGAKGSSGVSGVVSRTDGSITYVDVAYAQQNHFSYAAVRNASGAYVLPDVTSIAAAAAAASGIGPNKPVSIVEPSASAPAAYPIATFSYAIVRPSSKTAALAQFLTYAVTTGQQFGPKLLFAPLPASIVAADKQAIAALR